MSDSAQHCLDLVRRRDRDRFLASLFAPAAKRPLLLALYAFNCEIARLPEVVSEPRLGDIRQQWWLDTLDGIYAGATAAHPVAQELARAVAAAGLPRHGLRNLVLARQFDLYADPMPSLTGLEGYLGETSSALIQMAAMILWGEEAAGVSDAAGLAGVAHGLAQVLCGGRSGPTLPRDLVGAHGEGETRHLLIRHARRRLAEARTKPVPVALLPAFLPVSLTDLYLDKVERTGLAAPGQVVEVSPLRRQLRLWRMARAERF